MICKLDPNKAHGYDMISIHMSKMSDNTIVEPIFTIFKKKKAQNVEHVRMTGKNEIFKLYLNNATNKTPKAIVQFGFFQSELRFSNVSYMVTC